MLASAITGAGLAELREALLELAPADFIDSPAIVGDLVGPGELAVLVVPIDKEAPKGRLILPQVQTIRDLLDTDALCMVVKERELRSALDRLKTPPVVPDRAAVILECSDQGRGIDPAIRDRLFEPFFTTKRDSGGTGLGLPVALGIVRESGGGIEIDSTPGRGTTVRVVFPAGAPEQERKE